MCPQLKTPTRQKKRPKYNLIITFYLHLATSLSICVGDMRLGIGKQTPLCFP